VLPRSSLVRPKLRWLWSRRARLRAHLEQCTARAQALSIKLSPDAFVFSPAPDGTEPTKLDTVTQKYARMAAKLGIDTHLHNLRHYSATELIAAGVDIRTVAGRLGHGGGGATTLRVYGLFASGWVVCSGCYWL